MKIELVVVPNTQNASHVKLIGRLDILAMKEVDVRFHGETATRERPAIAYTAIVDKWLYCA